VKRQEAAVAEVRRARKHAEAEKLAEEAVVLGRSWLAVSLTAAEAWRSGLGTWAVGRRFSSRLTASTTQEVKGAVEGKAAIGVQESPLRPHKEVAMQSVVKEDHNTARKVKPTPGTRDRDKRLTGVS